MNCCTSNLNPPRHKKLIIGILVALVLAAAFAWLSRAKPLAVVLVAVERGTVEASVSNTRAGTVNACRRAKSRETSFLLGDRLSECHESLTPMTIPDPNDHALTTPMTHDPNDPIG